MEEELTIDVDSHNSSVYEATATIAIALLGTPNMKDECREELAENLEFLMKSSLKD